MQAPLDNDDEEQEKLRLENEIKKIKLSLEHGMDMSQSYSDADLPPEVEGEFLDHIKQWEEQFALRKRIVLYDFIERPEYIALSAIADEAQLKTELERIVDLMKGFGVFIDTICEVEERELYRFITEEFFKDEMDDIRIEGMMHCFTYEDYYPNHEYDVKSRCTEFVNYIFDKREGIPDSWSLADNIRAGEKQYTKKEFAEKLSYFRDSFSAFTLHTFEPQSVTLNEPANDAQARYHIHYSAEIDGSAECVNFEGNCTFWLQRDEEWWSVYAYEMPGVVV